MCSLHFFETHWDHEPSPLTRPSGTLSPSEGERDGVRGRVHGKFPAELFHGKREPADEAPGSADRYGPRPPVFSPDSKVSARKRSPTRTGRTRAIFPTRSRPSPSRPPKAGTTARQPERARAK